MNIIENIQQWANTKFQRWLVKQVPKATTQVLSRRNIFIFPSRFGFSYLFFVLLLFVLGTNYQNNLIILLSYLLASVFITAMLQSFNNLAKLTISVNSQQLKGFAQGTINVPIQLNSAKKRFAYQLFFQTDNKVKQDAFSAKQTCYVPFTLAKRGTVQLPRLTLQSYFSLGLFRCWTRLDLNVSAVAYPKPERPAQMNIEQFLTANESATNNELPNEALALNHGVDEFNELAPYQRGESLAKVAWKQVARGQGWYIKNYDQLIDTTPNWLSLAALPKAPIEQQLCWLSFLVIELQKRDKIYGLTLKTTIIPPEKGLEHSHTCLKALALYG